VRAWLALAQFGPSRRRTALPRDGLVEDLLVSSASVDAPPEVISTPAVASRARQEALSPVMRALRFAGEEVQLGLVLASICQDPKVATAFADAVVARSRFGNPRARRQAKRAHADVYCLGEQYLQARITRSHSRARWKDVGRVDLSFSSLARDWALTVELKLNSDFGPKQLERYGDAGLVAAIVRDASTVERLTSHPNWVGVASWEWLSDDLRTLPVDDLWRAQWLALLDVIDADGDFASSSPSSREVEAQAELLEAIAQPLVDHFAEALRRVYRSSADVAVSSLHSTRIHESRVWAGTGIAAADGTWVWIAIRNYWSPAPRLSIDHYAFDDWRARRRLEQAHARLERRLGFTRQRGGTFRREAPLPALASASHEQAITVIAPILTALVDSRAFDVEVERVHRGYG